VTKVVERIKRALLKEMEPRKRKRARIVPVGWLKKRLVERPAPKLLLSLLVAAVG